MLDFHIKPLVLVTGFGPFSGHPVNASWEAVKLMNKDELEKKHNIELVQLEIPVTYENVDEFVPALWETHEPKLTVHVGVSSVATDLTLEMQAHKKGYQRLDYFDKCPTNNICPADGAMRLHTKLNVERICQLYNESNPEEQIKAVSSRDAGRYLCEYIYYHSLSIDSTRTLFIHVPSAALSPPVRTARGLERVVSLCLQQLADPACLQQLADPACLQQLADPACLQQLADPACLQQLADPACLQQLADPAGERGLCERLEDARLEENGLNGV